MENAYQPPKADLTLPEDRPASAVSPLFVTSIRKMALLYLLTLGLYSVYWFYKHWDIQKRLHGAPVMPAPRSLFHIFFTHSLFARIAESYEAATGKPWHSRNMASLYVLASVASQILDKVSGKAEGISLLDVASLAILPLTLLPLCIAQKHANIAAHDAQGQGNQRLSLLNWLFILPFAALWTVILFGFAAAAGLVPDTLAQAIADLFLSIRGSE